MRSSTRTHWDIFWQQPDPRITRQEFNPKLVTALIAALGDPTGKKILEAGCGTAVDSIELRRLGARVVAYDYSRPVLAIAANKAAELDAFLDLNQGDILALPYADQTFDAVFSAGVLEHFREPAAVLSEQRRVLKPAGVLLVDVPQTFNLYTLYKLHQIRAGTWFAGWETQFRIGELETLLQTSGFEVGGTYGYGYYPAILAKVRWLSNFGKGIIGRPFMLERVARRYEQMWRRIEETRAFLYVAQCIGVVCRRAE